MYTYYVCLLENVTVNGIKIPLKDFYYYDPLAVVPKSVSG
jgi:hypothetical protein